MEEIIQFDKHLLLMLNGSDSVFLDHLIMILTNAKTWIPLYLGLFYVVVKSNKHIFDILFDGYRGGNYGFFSAHASNTFSIALFFSLLMRRKLFVFFMITWSLVNCWTRIYLGVHYPGDIAVGLLWGALVGYFVYRLYCRVALPRHTRKPRRYEMRHLYVPITILCLTYLYAAIRAAIMA